MLEMMIWTTFTIASIVSLTAVEFRICQNVQNKQQFRKLWKYCKSHKHSVRNIGNDDLNYVWYSYHDAPHRSRNFE